MNITLIDIGNIANDGTGDDLRTAFQKVNENFVELETSVDASTVAANIGGGVGIFKQKVENTLQFRSLETDDKLSVTTVGDKVVISTNFQNKNIAVGSLNATGSVSATSMTATMFNGSVNGNLMGRVYPLAPDYIIGAGSIDGVRPAPNSFYLLADQTSNSSTVILKKAYKNSQGQIIPSNEVPTIGRFIRSPGAIDVKINSVVVNVSTYTLGLASAFSVVSGRNYTISEEYLPGRVDGVSVRDLNNTINTFDFGTLDNQYTSAFQYLLSRVGLDLGTIISPTDLSIDAGTL